MTSGKPFTAEERAYIADHAYTMSWGRIADELEERYPEAGGRRHPRSIRNYVRRRDLKGEFVSLTVTVPFDVALQIRDAHMTPADMGSLLVVGLAARARS